jgi:hypothetical protein
MDALKAMAAEFEQQKEELLATRVTFDEWQQRAADRLFERLRAGGSRLVTTELLVRSMRFCASSLGVSFKKMPALYNHMWTLLMGTEPKKSFPCERTCKAQTVGITQYEKEQLGQLLTPGTPVTLLLDSSRRKGRHLLPIYITYFDHAMQVPRIICVAMETMTGTSAADHLQALQRHIGAFCCCALCAWLSSVSFVFALLTTV